MDIKTLWETARSWSTRSGVQQMMIFGLARRSLRMMSTIGAESGNYSAKTRLGKKNAVSALSVDEEGVFGTYPIQATDGTWQWQFVERLAAARDREVMDETVPQTTAVPEKTLTGPIL